MPSLKELWKISGYFYKDLAFRAIYEIRAQRNLERVVRSAKRSMLINKIVLAFMLAGMAVYTAFRSNVVDFVIFYAMVMFLLAFFFLQATTTFSSQKFDLLFTLPLSRDEVFRVITLTFFRIFDIPILAVTLVFPIATMVKSPASMIPAFLGLISSEFFAIGLVVYMTKVFSKVTSSGFRSLIRVIFYVLWAFTFFAFYAFATIVGRIYSAAEAYSAIIESNGHILALLFPFCFAFLTCGYVIGTALMGSVVWSILACLSFRWAVSNVKNLFAKFEHVEDSELRMKISSPTVAFLKKDLRVISRSPAHFFLVMLPIMEGVLLSLISKNPIQPLSMVLAFLVVVTYSLHGLEKSGMVRLLPVRSRVIVLSKTILIVTIYILSIAATFITSAVTGANPDIQLSISMIPSVFAMSVVVLAIAEKMGVRRDIYSGLSALVFLMIPGMLIVYAPIAVAFFFKFFYGEFLVPLLVAVFTEFLIALILLNVL